MKIGFFLNNCSLPNSESVSYSKLSNENPGCGGTEYLTIFLICALSKKGHELYCFSKESITFDDKKICFKNISTLPEAVNYFSKTVDDGLFVVIPRSAEELNFKKPNNIRIITWGHCFYTAEIVRKINKLNPDVNVFLTEASRNKYYNTKLYNKSIVIGNFTQTHFCPQPRAYNPQKTNIVYIGSLSGYKNADCVTKAWPIVIKKYPTAKLYIIGSSKLHYKNLKTGSLGVATEEYERELLYPLIKHNCVNSVKFLGLMHGSEIFKTINEATIGIVNPIGTTETFCTSAIEFGCKGVPVVGGNYGGLKNTIPNKCGYRVNNHKQLARKIIYLLKNPEKNIELGSNYFNFVQKNYSETVFVNAWVSLIEGKIVHNSKRSILKALPITIANTYSDFRILLYRIRHYFWKKMHIR